MARLKYKTQAVNSAIDPCEFNIRSGGRTGTLAAVWRH